MGGAQAANGQMVVTNEHIPERNKSSPLDELFTPYDTQETKLKKVREELLESIRKHSHKDILDLIECMHAHIDALEYRLDNLENELTTVKMPQRSTWKYVKPSKNPDFCTVSNIVESLKKEGVELISQAILAEWLIVKGYLCRASKKELVPTGKDDSIFLKKGTRTTTGLASWDLKCDFAENVIIPYFLKQQKAMESVEND